MRDRYEIKTEIDAVQEDLEANIAQLKDVITEKADIRGKVNAKVEETKAQARNAVARGREVATDLYAQARQFVREQPLATAGIVTGILIVGGALLAIRTQLRERALRQQALQRHDDEDLVSRLRALFYELQARGHEAVG
jgi:ElaB/YqjD/DUF883 family membrane-anchored ribosome-binding protein